MRTKSANGIISESSPVPGHPEKCVSTSIDLGNSPSRPEFPELPIIPISLLIIPTNLTLCSTMSSETVGSRHGTKNLRKICVWENFWIFLIFFSFFYRNKRENSFHQTKWRFSLSLTLALTFTVSTSSGDLWSPLSEVLLNVPQALLLAQAGILISMIVYHIWYDIYDSSIKLYK